MPFQFSSFLNDLNNLNRNRVILTPRRRKVYKTRFNPMGLSDGEFKNKYRFSKVNMKKIIEIVRADLSNDNRQVMAAIRYWGRNEIQDYGGDIHGFSQPTLCQICKRVARALASKRSTYVKMPTSLSDQIRTMNQFFQIRRFPKIVGAIDCTHIKIPRVGGPSGQYYVNRKGYYSLNTQVVCDESLKIMDIACLWRGSTHDSRIFRESRIKQRFEIGASSMVVCLGMVVTLVPISYLPPLENPQTDAEKRYNIAHIATRNTVERCFGVWKQRFRILLTGMRCSLENAKTTVIALAVLHNLAIDFKDIIPTTDYDVIDNNQPYSSDNQEILQPQTNQNLTRRVFIEQFFSRNN